MIQPFKGAFVALLSAAAVAVADPTSRAESDPVVAKGIQYLKSRVNGAGIGETALAGLAMIKFDVPFSDPALAACVNKLRARITSGVYTPERTGGTDIYEAALVAMFLANLDAESRRGSLDAVAQYLISKQKPKGCWDYDSRTNGDCSISQYGVLGLWEAESAGARVPPEVWDRAARFYISAQRPDGSWIYHPDENPESPGTISMTAAGVGSLLICRRQLNLASKSITADLSPLLVPLAAEGADGTYEPRVSTASIDRAVKRGLSWLGANFATEGASIGHSVYYGLYGIERIGALADRETLGRVNWFDLGQQFIHSKQMTDGSWNSEFGPEANTAWAILFLTKSTSKTLRRIEIKRLGAGTLLGGRDLPKDLTSMTVAGGRVISRPMNGAIEGMLAVLEDPRAQNADSALSGLVTRYETQGPIALRPHKPRFFALLSDRDPGLRRVAAWALGRTADLDVVPALIGALNDPDEDVVTAARLSLQLLSRKVDGFGPPSPSSPEQRRDAARKWRSWYDAIRPLDVDGQDLEDASSPGRLR